MSDNRRVGLILGRNIGERVIIGNYDAIITVTAIKGKQVKLGFDFPPETAVLREELIIKDGECDNEAV